MDIYGVCMQLYELVLAALGIILFISAIVFTALKRDVKLVISMYLISVVMIAFPALSKVAFAEVTLEVQRLECINQKLVNNPTDTSLRNHAQNQIEIIKKDGLDSTNAKTVAIVATANALLGDSVKAAQWADKGLQFNPDSKPLLDLRNNVLTPRVRVEYLVSKLNQNPGDSAAKQQLKQDAALLEENAPRNARSFTTLGKAKLVLGDTAQAKKFVDSALQHNPANKEAIDLKKNLQPRNRR
jgi:tetratricopeptide (TPR) repeat protein